MPFFLARSCVAGMRAERRRRIIIIASLQSFRAAVKALASGALGSLDRVETRALGDGAQAFADLQAGKTAAAKIALRPREPAGASPLRG